VPFEEKLEKYIDDHFKLNDDGTLCTVRKGNFNGNGLLQPINIDDLEDLAAWAKSQANVRG